MPIRSIYILLFLLPLFLAGCVAGRRPAKQAAKEAAAYQAHLNATYTNAKTTILPAEELARLQQLGGLPFFPIDPAYRVEASFRRYEKPEIIQMKTSGTRISEYAVFGLATFELNGKTHELTLYRSTRVNMPVEYQNSLFLPFLDQTSGDQTYGGGRYMDIEIPTGDTIVIDFNKAYHPYCAYTTGYNCPVVPRNNVLDTEVLAGIRMVDLGGD